MLVFMLSSVDARIFKLKTDKLNLSKLQCSDDASDNRTPSSRSKKGKRNRDEYVASVDLAEDKCRF